MNIDRVCYILIFVKKRATMQKETTQSNHCMLRKMPSHVIYV